MLATEHNVRKIIKDINRTGEYYPIKMIKWRVDSFGEQNYELLLKTGRGWTDQGKRSEWEPIELGGVGTIRWVYDTLKKRYSGLVPDMEYYHPDTEYNRSRRLTCQPL